MRAPIFASDARNIERRPSMKRHSFLFTGLLSVALAIGSILSAGAADLITNGSFENYNVAQIGAYGYASSWTAIDNWTGTDSDGYVTRIGINGDGADNNANSTQFANNGALPDGAGSHVAFFQAPGLGGNTKLSQSISGLSDGQNYVLSFRVNAQDQPYPGLTLAVTLGTTVLMSATSEVAVDPISVHLSPYRSVSIPFTYNSGTFGGTTLSFTDSTPSFDGSVLLDNVSLIAVPEPSTVALAGLGLAGFAWRVRRRKA